MSLSLDVTISVIGASALGYLLNTNCGDPLAWLSAKLINVQFLRKKEPEEAHSLEFASEAQTQ